MFLRYFVIIVYYFHHFKPSPFFTVMVVKIFKENCYGFIHRLTVIYLFSFWVKEVCGSLPTKTQFILHFLNVFVTFDGIPNDFFSFHSFPVPDFFPCGFCCQMKFGFVSLCFIFRSCYCGSFFFFFFFL